MSSKNTSSSIGFSGMLTVLFIGLKLTDNIEWSWWWVLSPVWISILIVLLVLVVILIVAVLVGLSE